MWQTIKDFPQYEINEFGVIRGKNTHYVISQRMNQNGYLVVQLLKDGKNHMKLVHRLVAETFIPNPNNLPIVNHIDECCVHNSADNLEWVTYQQNSNHGTRNERIIRNRKNPVIAVDEYGHVIDLFESKHDAARKLGVTEAAIRASIKKSCRCKGMFFKLADSEKNNIKENNYDFE